MRHTVGMRRIIHSLVVEGKHKGEFNAALNINSATSLVYSLFEAAILRITISGGAKISDSIDSLDTLLFTFKAKVH
jgi:hypothetical protein